MVVVHLTASTFLGGPEHQMLGLARSLPGGYRSIFVSFREGGRCAAFLDAARGLGFEALALKHDTPRLRSASRELTGHLRRLGANVVCSHGYKTDLLGLPAARRAGVPIVAVSHGWTGESLKVRLYEALDRRVLRRMDRVVCVSEGQAAKVRRAGVPGDRVAVIRDAVRAERFGAPDPAYADRLRGLVAGAPGPIVGAAGRLSPEKGFPVLIEAAGIVNRTNPSVRFVLFGEGRLRADLERQIAAGGLRGAFILAGFRTDLDRFLPHLDLLALPSYTEGLPNVVLEAFAAGVPAVATAVGGTPEAIDDGVSGYLVPPGEPLALARRILDALGDDVRRRAMGQNGRRRVLDDFTFESQNSRYQELFRAIVQPGGRHEVGTTIDAGEAAR